LSIPRPVGAASQHGPIAFLRERVTDSARSILAQPGARGRDGPCWLCGAVADAEHATIGDGVGARCREPGG